jgi:L-ascorbate metabolism protein UlaG (beta-lactamase superfamily)
VHNPLKLKAEIVTVSCNDRAHNNLSAVKGDSFEITGPGEYERGGVFITGIQTTPHNLDGKALRNTLYVLDYGKLTILHLRNVNFEPSQSLIEELGNINIAMVPVGDGGALNASKAAEVISMLEPNIVIPMQYETPYSKLGLDPLSKFLKKIGNTLAGDDGVL